MKILFSLLVLILSFSPSWSQHNIDSLHRLKICTPNGYAIPTIIGQPRSKGVEIYQERTPSYQLKSNFENTDSSATSEVRRTKSWKVKFRAPIVNRENFKLIAGFQYYQEEFAFSNPESLTNSFHQGLQDKPLRSVGLTLNVFKPFIGNKYMLSRVTLRLNGDLETGDAADYLKSSYSLLYGIKRSALKTWGVGVSYSNSFGRSRIYPLLFLNYKIRPKWTVKILLPVSVQVLYVLNDKNTFYFSNKLEGDNYNLNFSILQQNTLYLEKADFKSFFTYEREIYDFVWLGISAGVRYNINFDVADSDNYFERSLSSANAENLVILNDLSLAPFFRFGLFLVPPRGWLK